MAQAGSSWQRVDAPDGQLAQASEVRPDDVACRRAAIVRAPGQSLEMDWSAHMACMAEAGWKVADRAVLVAQREGARNERRRMIALRKQQKFQTEPVYASERSVEIDAPSLGATD